MRIRPATEADYMPIIRVLNEWWGGRQMSDMLPRLFFQHFQSTSFIAWEQDERVGFLIGFCSQTHPDEGYIHFIGVHPDHRKSGVARQLYERFFQVMREHGRNTVRCITSPMNETSIRFHKSMGFAIKEGDHNRNGFSFHPSYDGVGQDRVLFVKKLSDEKYDAVKRNWRDLSYLQEGTPRQREAWHAITGCRIMDCLKQYDPVLAGTIPLDVDIAGSDLDIVCSCNDLDAFDLLVHKNYGHISGYRASRETVHDNPTSLIRFTYGGFAFELFAQNVPVHRQNAYRHMEIEARLLELAGPQARMHIRKLKQNGLKTEPAFAHYFHIPGPDPYQTLLELECLSDAQLHQHILGSQA